MHFCNYVYFLRYVRTYDPEKRESMMKVHVGNAASDTELTFEYGVRKHNEAQAKHPQEASLCPQGILYN
jgi:hypothetical protein